MERLSDHFVATMEAFYRRVDARVAALNPVCQLSGRCCRFGEHGHRMYVTRPELLYFLYHQRRTGLRPITQDACPYQQGKLCTAREHRPLGCRIYFCDPTAQAWQHSLYEEFLTELKEIGRRFGIEYAYRDWLAVLADGAPRISVIIPNWNRREVIHETLAALGADLPAWAEVLVVDNASSDGAADMVRREFPWAGLVRLRRNLGTAARNVGLKYARGTCTLMLDNDSHPLPGALARIEAHFARDSTLGAIGGRIMVRLDPPRYESGGLPGVFIGCGAAFRTAALREIGGYPEDYGYYVEEYDVSCRLWRAGWKIRHMADVPIHHRKVSAGRDMNQILRRLVANNLKLWRRHSPPNHYRRHQWETVSRYFQIARKEEALAGYFRGLAEGLPELARGNGGRPLDEPQYRALFGLNEARDVLAEAAGRLGRSGLAVFGIDKGLPQVFQALYECGLVPLAIIDPDGRQSAGRRSAVPLVDAGGAGGLGASWLVIGSLSPGGAENLRLRAKALLPGMPAVKLCDYA